MYKHLQWRLSERINAKYRDYVVAPDDLQMHPIDVRAADYRYLEDPHHVVFRGDYIYLNIVGSHTDVPIRVKVALRGVHVTPNLHSMAAAPHVVELRAMIARFNFARDRETFNEVYESYVRLEELLTKLYIQSSRFVHSSHKIMDDYKRHDGLTMYRLFYLIRKCLVTFYPDSVRRTLITGITMLEVRPGGETSVTYDI